MAIPHANSGDPIDVLPLRDKLPAEKTVALFKSRDLEVMRLVLAAGKSVPPHKVPGELTLQCLEGRIDVKVDDTSHLLGAGQLLFLSGGVVHSVAALEDASALVTIALKP